MGAGQAKKDKPPSRKETVEKKLGEGGNGGGGGGTTAGPAGEDGSTEGKSGSQVGGEVIGLKNKVARQIRKSSAIFQTLGAKAGGRESQAGKRGVGARGQAESVAAAPMPRGSSFDSTKIIRDIVPDSVVGEALQSVPLFAHLNQTEREKIGGATEELMYENGDVVFSEGDRGEAFYIVKSGKAKVTKFDAATGKQIVLIELTAGDHFGEQGLFNSEQLVSVTAVGDLGLWSIPRNIFKTLFKEDRIDVKFATRDELPSKGRGAVSAESTHAEQKDVALPLPQVEMSPETETLVLRAVHNSLLFQAFEDEHKRMVAHVMAQQVVLAGQVLIVEGTEGNTFYVIEEGEFDVFQMREGVQVQVDNHKTGGSFGELALMYDAPRNATVVAACDSKVRVLQRAWFNQIAKELGTARLEQYSNWLKRIELLAPLTNFERNQIAEALEVVDIESAGVDIFKQGEQGDAMYIVVRGEVVFSVVHPNGTVEEIGRCGEEDYFGERALIHGSLRAATATTTMGTRVVKLDVESFVSLLGPLEGVLGKKEGKDEPRVVEWKRTNVALAELKVIGVLGQGSYGSVMLTQGPNGHTYALKAVSKQRIVETKQKDHIYNEKNLMAQMDHPMLVKLHNTYQDADRLYFLLEPVLGGEMFPLLRRHKTFPPPQAKFYAACVVLAFEYMHKRDFIYRDLKPENLLLDDDGYLKITDFGFTKKVPHKTWTMCGTPEYMAPEIISHNGHGRAVDWWCIGIFIFEMLASYTPFYGKGGNMKMYERVVRGTFNVPSHISPEAKALIRGLLRTRPHMRLGMLKVGADSIKCHPWFQGFDWQALLWRKMKAPYIPKVEGITDVTNYKQDIKHMTVKPYVDDGTNWDADF